MVVAPRRAERRRGRRSRRSPGRRGAPRARRRLRGSRRPRSPAALAFAKPQAATKLRQRVELLEELVVESPPALVGGESFVPEGRRVERVPADEDRARLLALVEPQEEIREADDRAAALVAAAPDGLRQRVIGPVREGIAVDDEERAAQGKPVSPPSSPSPAPSSRPWRACARRSSSRAPSCSRLASRSAMLLRSASMRLTTFEGRGASGARDRLAGLLRFQELDARRSRSGPRRRSGRNRPELRSMMCAARSSISPGSFRSGISSK